MLGAVSAACAQEPTLPNELQPLVPKLSASDLHVQNAAAREIVDYLKTRGAEGIETVARLFLESGFRGYYLEVLFRESQTPEAREAIAEFVTHENMELRGYAIQALSEFPCDSQSETFLRAARHFAEEPREGSLTGRARMDFAVSRALWKADQTAEAAEAILTLSRLHEGEQRLDLLAVLDTETGVGFMNAEDRLHFILKRVLAKRARSPQALEIVFEPRAGKESLFPDGATQAFVEAHREAAITIMRKELDEEGTNQSALLLGYFKDAFSIPALKRQFIYSESWSPGWYSSIPDMFAYYQFTAHHCYESALTHITGKPLEEIIELSETQIGELKEIAPMGYGMNALYVLHRLRPDIAQPILINKYKEMRGKKYGSEGWVPLTLVQHYVSEGMTGSMVKNVLGTPDRIDGRTWIYRVPSWGERKSIHVTMSGGTEDSHVEGWTYE